MCLNKILISYLILVNEVFQPRKLLIIRHGERMDFVFKTWIQDCFDSSGHYFRKDVNMPKNVPFRDNKQDFQFDPPLTVIGTVQASLIGEALKDESLSIDQVYCSPSLRCLQTSHNLLKGLGLLELPINIEPGKLIFSEFVSHIYIHI